MENVGVAKNNKLGDFTKLVAVSAGHFINDFYMNIIPPILFLFTSAMSLTLTQQAMIAMVITSSGSFAQPLIGYFVDRHGRPWFLIISVAWIAIWMCLAGIVDNYFLVLLVTGLGALGSALYHPLGTAAAIRLGKKTRGTSLSIFMTVGTFAMAFPPLIALPVVRDHGLSALTYFMIPGILISLLMYIGKVGQINVTIEPSQDQELINKSESNAYKWVSVLVLIATYRTFLTRGLMTFGVQLLLLKEVDITIAGIILSSYLFLNAGGTMAGGILDDYIGSKKVMVATNIVILLCMLGLFMTSGIAFIISFIIMGFALTVANTSNIVMTHDYLPNNINMGTGLILGLAGGLAGLCILLYGRLADLFGLINATGVFIIPLIILSVLTILLPGKIKESIAKEGE